MDPADLPPPLLSPLHPPHLTRVLAGTRLAFDLAYRAWDGGGQRLSQCVQCAVSGYALRLISITAVHCIALRGERYRDTDSVSISITMQCHATQRAAAVMEISL